MVCELKKAHHIFYVLDWRNEIKQLTLLECSKTRLNEIYLVVYAIKNEINIKKAEDIEKGDIYTLIDIDLKGVRQFLYLKYIEKFV